MSTLTRPFNVGDQGGVGGPVDHWEGGPGAHHHFVGVPGEGVGALAAGHEVAVSRAD